MQKNILKSLSKSEESGEEKNKFVNICKVLQIYTTTYDITNCLKLLKLIKADIKALESIKK